MELNRKKTGQIRLIFISLICVVVIAMATIIPKQLIDYQANAGLSQVFTDSTSSSYAISKSLSENLTEDEQLQLICKIWDSNMEVVDISEHEYFSNSEIEIIERLNEEFETKIVTNVDSLYEDTFVNDTRSYYTYNVVLYKCTDSVFNTYFTYLWGITFTRYDNSRVYEFLMTDYDKIIYFSRNDTNDKSTETIYQRYYAEIEDNSNIDTTIYSSKKDGYTFSGSNVDHYIYALTK